MDAVSNFGPQLGHTTLTMGESNSTQADRQLDKLVLTLDRIATCMEKSNVGIYERVLNSAEIGNPGPIGLFAFAIALSFYMAAQAHLTEQSAMFIAFTLATFFGGLAMLISGFLMLIQKNSLAATAFTVYGSFLMTVGVYGIIRAAGIFYLETPHGEQALTIIMGFVSLALFPLGFFLLAAGVDNVTCARVAGWWGIWSSICAFYGACAVLLRDMWAGRVLPQFHTKGWLADEKLWMPRVKADPDSFEIEDGWQKKGRAF